MLRVHGPDGARDFDANTAQEQPGGGLLLCRVEVREVRDPHNLAHARAEISNPVLVRLIAANRWFEVENLDMSDNTEVPTLALAGGTP